MRGRSCGPRRPTATGQGAEGFVATAATAVAVVVVVVVVVAIERVCGGSRVVNDLLADLAFARDRCLLQGHHGTTSFTSYASPHPPDRMTRDEQGSSPPSDNENRRISGRALDRKEFGVHLMTSC